MILKVVAILVGIMTVVWIGKQIYRRYSLYNTSRQWILQGTKSAKKGKIISQDPKVAGSIAIKRSENEQGGLEFSYGFWMFIEDWSYKYGQWKHVFHKGNASRSPNQAPGVLLHPEKNIMRVYMNSYAKIDEHVDIDNLPLNKWFYVIIAVQQKDLDVYINGNLAKRLALQGIPKQNYGDIYLNSDRGFGGFISNMRYYDYYMPFSEMDQNMSEGPSTAPCVDTREMPPYFSSSWWANHK